MLSGRSGALAQLLTPPHCSLTTRCDGLPLPGKAAEVLQCAWKSNSDSFPQRSHSCSSSWEWQAHLQCCLYVASALEDWLSTKALLALGSLCPDLPMHKQALLTALEQHQLYAEASKCQYGKIELDPLEHPISGAGDKLNSA